MAVDTAVSRRTLLIGGALIAAAAAGATVLATGSGPANATGVIYKSPTCGCCSAWTEQMAAAGLKLEVSHPADLGAIKDQYGIPYDMSSCHTAVIEGYAFEGHVPISHVKRVLAEHPAVAGLAVPGMPGGSPGMESAPAEPYTVYAVRRDGSTVPLETVTP